MELRIYIVILFLLITNNSLFAQSISVEPSHNNLSNGVGLLYNCPIGKGWQTSIGIRYLVNIFSINDNIKGHVYYQNGFATTLPEHLGAIARVSKKLYSKGKFRLDGFSNLLINYTSLKRKFYHSRFPPVPAGYPDVDVFLMEPSWSYELTIGPKINYKIAKRSSLHLMAGYGIMIDFYNDKGVSLITGDPVIVQAAGWEHKWEYEMVGFEFLPTLTFGLTYSL